MSVREMTIGDYDAVIKLWENTPGIGLSEADSQENIAKFLERNAGLSFLAETENAVVGTILCGHDGRRGFIYHLVVKDKLRHKGLGKGLVAKCLALLEEDGIEKCHLFVFNNNDIGISFWDKVGWTKRDDLLVFSKRV
ncbi:MAG: GNAT family N-acetyltransferase [Bacillota bacterium]